MQRVSSCSYAFVPNVALDLIPWPPRSPDLDYFIFERPLLEELYRSIVWPNRIILTRPAVPSNGGRLTWIFKTPCIGIGMNLRGIYLISISSLCSFLLHLCIC